MVMRAATKMDDGSSPPDRRRRPRRPYAPGAAAVPLLLLVAAVLIWPSPAVGAWVSPGAVSPPSSRKVAATTTAIVGALSASASGSGGGGEGVGEGEGSSSYIRMTPSEEDRPSYPPPREINEALLGDLTGGRPGAIIETEEQLASKARILKEIESGDRKYPKWATDDYGESIEDEEAEYDIDDPDAIDAATLGTWSIQDIRSKFDYEWDPNGDEPDPNVRELNVPGTRYVETNELDDDGVEVGYDPIFGPSNPMDQRTILGTKDSYMIDDATRDDTMLTPQFAPNDPEIDLNDDVVKFRKSLDIIETYVDDFLPGELEIPRHVAKWHGYPEKTHFEPKNYTNNRFTDEPTDFDSMTPWQARRRAVELARAKNAEWLPDGVSQEWHASQREPYEKYETLAGTLRRGDCDPDVVESIRPALDVLGSCVDLLSTHRVDEEGGTVFRFAYYGLMKNKFGMKCWTEQMIRENCGVDVTGVVFETGFRRRDPAYDGGDHWNGPTF